jgi:hypothetical protein
MKTISLKRPLIIFVWLFAISISFGLPQEKPTTAKKATEEKTVTIVKDQSGAITESTRSTYSDLDEDLSPEPRTDIWLKIKLLEIRPSETRAILSPEGRVETGQTWSFLMGSGKTPSISLNITPNVIENKGVQLKITFKKEPEMNEPVERTILTGNLQQALIELFENKSANSKLAMAITPIIDVKLLAKEYPGVLNEIQFVKSILTMNEDKLLARGGLSVKNAMGEIFPYIYVQGKGIYVLSFKPFEGAEPRGVVKGDKMKIKFGEDEFSWLSQQPILPSEGPWLVWVRFNPHFQSVGVVREYLETKNGFVGIGLEKDSWRKFF